MWFLYCGLPILPYISGETGKYQSKKNQPEEKEESYPVPAYYKNC